MTLKFLFLVDLRQNSYREPPLPTPAANYSEDDEEEDTSFSQVSFDKGGNLTKHLNGHLALSLLLSISLVFTLL